MQYAAEKEFAIAAVRRACGLTDSVFNKLVKNETLTKNDKSPVTVGDYAAQALISSMLTHAFPLDPIVGEEDAAELRAESGKDMRDRIVELANEALTTDDSDKRWGIGQAKTADQILDAIDRGNHSGGAHGRMWTIDPIDGTKGFLRGEQYAVCLALIVDAKVQVGVIGCPNLPWDLDKPEERGCIFVAVRGQGAEQTTITEPSLRALRIPSSAPLRFLESVEAAHSSHSTNDRVAESLQDKVLPAIRMDSQAKYGCLARGDGAVYLRMPTKAGYKEKIWDHAPGSLIVQEAGGIVTDSRGHELDFGLGRTLGENYGVVGAAPNVHGEILNALKQVAEQDETKAKA
ncbi:hypothetical protein C8J56DRAFT_937479 [Mycena floridula]|nr:hypothetical protein C8J56DRAFT_937479 [Mycena floridula]